MLTIRVREKSAVFEARQIDTLDYDGMCEIIRWCGGAAIDRGDKVIAVRTVLGRLDLDLGHGDWVLRHPNGTFFGCNPDEFRMRYETTPG
jgi:hypothetical protein